MAREGIVEVGASGCARIDTVGVGDEHSGSRGHGGGGRRIVALKLMQWGWETSGRARKDGRGVRRAIGPERT